MIYKPVYIKAIKDAEKRIIYGKICDGLLDRDGEIVRISAFTDEAINRYMANPVLMLSHESKSLPLGKVLDVNRWLGDGVYMEARIVKGITTADEFWQMIKDIGCCGFSIGFLSRQADEMFVKKLTEREQKSCYDRGLKSLDKVRVFKEIDLLEVSAVSVPSCPTCLLINYKAGKIKTKSLQDTCRSVMFNGESKLNCMRSDLREIEEGIETLRKRKMAEPEQVTFNEKEFEEYIDEKVAQIDLDDLLKKVFDEQIRICIAKRTGKVW